MSNTKNQKLISSIKVGIIGGLIAGVFFGIMMQIMGKIAMIAEMLGSESVIVGWLAHLMISAIFGIGFGIIAVKSKKVISLSLVYGVILWIIGPLVMMPIMLGMGTELFNAFTLEQMINLMGHLIYAVILGVIYKNYSRKLKGE